MKAFFTTYWIVVVLGIIGWILNIAQIVGMSSVNGLMIVKIIGAFLAPLGAVMGWVGVF